MFEFFIRGLGDARPVNKDLLLVVVVVDVSVSGAEEGLRAVLGAKMEDESPVFQSKDSRPVVWVSDGDGAVESLCQAIYRPWSTGSGDDVHHNREGFRSSIRG